MNHYNRNARSPPFEGDLWKGKPGLVLEVEVFTTETGFLARSPQFPDLVGRGSGLDGRANALQHFTVLLDYHLKGVTGGLPSQL